jgi:hypothetical protein
VFENNSFWLSILLLGTSTNRKVKNLENKETAEAQECTFSARNSRTDNVVCGGVMKREGSNHLQYPIEI